MAGSSSGRDLARQLDMLEPIAPAPLFKTPLELLRSLLGGDLWEGWDATFVTYDVPLRQVSIDSFEPHYGDTPLTVDHESPAFVRSSPIPRCFDDGYITSISPTNSMSSLGLCSTIGSSGKMFVDRGLHIPMADLVGRPSIQKLKAFVERMSQFVGVPVFLFDSGASYHLYAYGLVGNDGLRRWLGALITFGTCAGAAHACDDALVDVRWIGHALQRGSCILRISPRDGVPIVGVAL